MLQGFCGPDLRAEERGLQPPPTPGPKNGNRAGCLQSLIIPAQSRHSGDNVGPRMAVPRCPDTGPAGSSARFLLASDEYPRLCGPSQCWPDPGEDEFRCHLDTGVESGKGTTKTVSELVAFNNCLACALLLRRCRASERHEAR